MRVRLPAVEREVLADLAGQLHSRLSCDLDASDLQRLFPPAYEESLADEAEYQELVSNDLLAGRRAALARFRESLGASTLSDEELDCWLRALNDLRLVLGTRLEVTQETFERPVLPGDPEAQDLAIYAYLSWLQEQVVAASRLPEPA